MTQRLAALRFFYVKTLKKSWSAAETPRKSKLLFGHSFQKLRTEVFDSPLDSLTENRIRIVRFAPNTIPQMTESPKQIAQKINSARRHSG